jgi:hypothetical protein
MAKEGNYGWSPRQMERINARRAARGQEQLVNSNNDEEEYYEDQPETKPKTQRGPAFPSKRPSTLDAYKGQKSLGERMAERPSTLDAYKEKNKALQANRAVEGAVKEENEERKRKGGKGISTPTLQDSFSRFTA